MFFDGIVDRFDRDDIRWGGYADEDYKSHFRIDDDYQYHQFF
jgi:hypothetical protein